MTGDRRAVKENKCVFLFHSFLDSVFASRLHLVHRLVVGDHASSKSTVLRPRTCNIDLRIRRYIWFNVPVSLKIQSLAILAAFHASYGPPFFVRHEARSSAPFHGN